MSLRHELSQLDLIMLGLGNIVGAGIFVITSKLIFYSGNYALAAICIVSLLSIILGYIYVKLYEKYQSETVEYEAIRDCINNSAGQLSLFLIYFFAIASCVTITVSLTKYITHSGYFYNKYKWDKLITIGLIIIMCAINYRGITTSKYVANTIGILMLIILGGIIFIGCITYLGILKIQRGADIDNIKPQQNGFVIATILSIFLFNGYDIIVKMSAESKDTSDVSTATLLVILITAIIYLAVIGSILYILGAKAASNTHHPLSLIYEKMSTPNITKASYIIGGFVMFNTAFISLLGGTRFFYGNVKNRPILNHLNQHNVPDIVILITFILAVTLSLIQNEVILAILTNFTVVIILLLLNISYIKIKWDERDNDNIMQFILKNSAYMLSGITLIILFIQIIRLKKYI